MEKLYLNLTCNSYSDKIKGFKQYQVRYLEIAKAKLLDYIYEGISKEEISALESRMCDKLRENRGQLDKRTLEKIEAMNSISISEDAISLLKIILETNTEIIFSLLDKVNNMQKVSLTFNLAYSETRELFEFKVVESNVKVEEYVSLKFPSTFLEHERYNCLVSLFFVVTYLVDIVLFNPFTFKSKEVEKSQISLEL